MVDFGDANLSCLAETTSRLHREMSFPLCGTVGTYCFFFENRVNHFLGRR